MADELAGVETWYGDGSGQIAVTDRLSRFVTKGELHIPNINPGGTVVNVPIAGLKPDGKWYVTATERTTVEIFDGYFRLVRVDRITWPEFEGEYVYYTVIQL